MARQTRAMHTLQSMRHQLEDMGFRECPVNLHPISFGKGIRYKKGSIHGYEHVCPNGVVTDVQLLLHTPSSIIQQRNPGCTIEIRYCGPDFEYDVPGRIIDQLWGYFSQIGYPVNEHGVQIQKRLFPDSYSAGEPQFDSPQRHSNFKP